MSHRASTPTHELSSESAPAAVSIYAVVVLFKQAAADSVTLRTLLASAGQLDRTGVRLHVLIYDNTPGLERTAPEIQNAILTVSYFSAAQNNGISGAYNHALCSAEREGYEWLLTLDQDTELPAEFLPVMVRLVRTHAKNGSIAAFAPHLVEGSRILSPVAVGRLTHWPLPRGFEGVPSGEARSLNSATLLRVAALRELGGFHPLFWLNYLDNWLHHELHRRGYSIYVAGELVVPHQLSLLDYRGRMTPVRYQDFLMAESAFRDLNDGPLRGLLHTAQLGVRWWNQHRRKENPAIRAATLRALLSRMVRSKRARLRAWSTGTEQRNRVPEA